MDPGTCYPELCTPREGHDSIRLSSGAELPVLDRHVSDDKAVMIEYVSRAEGRQMKALCSEAEEAVEAVLADPRNADAPRIALGATTPSGVDWQNGRFVTCCGTTYLTLQRDSDGRWHLRPCEALKLKDAF